jgi:hypothetical protein
MNVNEDFLQRIAGRLQGAGLEDFAAFILEASGPFSFLGAQIVYIIEPLMGLTTNDFHKLGRILEDPDQVLELAKRLRRED